MYQNIYFDRQKSLMYIFDDKKGCFSFQYDPTCFIKSNFPSKFKSIYGDNVTEKKISDITNTDVTFEYDLNPELKVLVELYFDSDEVSQNNIVFIDIETDSKNGFPNLKTYDKEIQSIALREFNKHTSVFVLDKKSTFSIQNSSSETYYCFSSEKELLIEFVNHFKSLHPTIVSGWNSENFDIPYILGRCKKSIGDYVNNLSPIGIIDDYQAKDYRKIRIAGVSHLDFMTIYKKYTSTTKDSYSLNNISKHELNETKKVYDGKLSELYENDINEFVKYNITDVLLLEKLENKLHYILTSINICHKGHISYDNVYLTSRIIEGALLVFMRKNNLVAPNKPERTLKLPESKFFGKIQNWKEQKLKIIVEEIEKDREYSIDISLLSDLDKIEIKNEESDNVFTFNKSEFLEFLDQYNIKISSIGRVYILYDSAKGAYVKPSLVGKYNWIIDLDYTSLYPSIIRTLNISPETKLGYIEDWYDVILEDYLSFLKGKETKYSSVKLKFKNSDFQLSYKRFSEFIKKYNLTISCNGILYSPAKRGIIPEILDTWFAERVLFKDKYKEAIKKSNKIKSKVGESYLTNPEYITAISESIRYNIRQITVKSLLNSAYGALLLNSFRFYDKDNGEAVTLTGQKLIKYAEFLVNMFLNNITGGVTDRVVAMDTDSTLINVEGCMDSNSIENVRLLANDLQLYVNNNLKEFIFPAFNISENKYLSMKQELIANGALFLGKKKYALWLLEKENIPVQELQVKGIDIVRSNFPEFFREELKNIVLMILNGCDNEKMNTKILDLKEKMKIEDVFSISIPTGVKNIDKYIDKNTRYKKGAPVYSKAVINYNILLHDLKLDLHHRPISENEKIKYVFLNTNEYDFETIAFNEDSPKQILDFARKYVNHERIFQGIMTKKLESFYKVLNWNL